MSAARKGWLLALLIIIALAACIVLVPLASIWALNALFGLSIAYTLKTWAAAMWLALLIGGRAAVGRRK